MKLKEIITKQLHAFHWGQFLFSKVQFIFTLLILIKVYNVSNSTKIIILISAVVFVWVIGLIFVKYIKEDFQKENMKGVDFNQK